MFEDRSEIYKILFNRLFEIENKYSRNNQKVRNLQIEPIFVESFKFGPDLVFQILVNVNFGQLGSVRWVVTFSLFLL